MKISETIYESDILLFSPENTLSKMIKKRDDEDEPIYNFPLSDDDIHLSISSEINESESGGVEIDLDTLVGQSFNLIQEKVKFILGNDFSGISELGDMKNWEVILVNCTYTDEEPTIVAYWRPIKKSFQKSTSLKEYTKKESINLSQFIHKLSISVEHLLSIKLKEKIQVPAGESEQKQNHKIAKVKKVPKRLDREQFLQRVQKYKLQEETTLPSYESTFSLFIIEKIQELFENWKEVLGNIEEIGLKPESILKVPSLEESQLASLEKDIKNFLLIRDTNNQSMTGLASYMNEDKDGGEKLLVLLSIILKEYFQKREYDKFFEFFNFVVHSVTTEGKTNEEIKNKGYGEDDVGVMILMRNFTRMLKGMTLSDNPELSAFKKIFGDFCFESLKKRLPNIIKRIEHMGFEHRTAILLKFARGDYKKEGEMKQLEQYQDFYIPFHLLGLFMCLIFLRGSSKMNDIQDLTKLFITTNLPGGQHPEKKLVHAFLSGQFQTLMRELPNRGWL